MASSPSAFRVEVVSTAGEDGPATAVVQVWGELDIMTAPMLAGVIQSVARPGVRVVADLSTVEFIDSSGVSALLVGSTRAKDGGGALVVRNPAPMVRRILEVLALGEVLPVEEIPS